MSILFVKQYMRTGRPKMADTQKKNLITGVRLRGDERELVEKAAAIRNQSLSDWIRTALLTVARRHTRTPI
jgi:uncharacterized protein (DUF1778 family)